MNHKAGLHVSFIGGFALLTLAVSTQVTLGHCGFKNLMLGKPWQVPAIGGLMLAAMLCRVVMDYDPDRFFVWMAVAASCFLLSTVVWAGFLVPKLRSR